MDAQSFPLAVLVPVPAEHWDHGLATDLAVPFDIPWLAVFDGEARSYWNNLGGNSLILSAADGTMAYYAHGNVPGLTGHVEAGQPIGRVGSTGNSTGPHLHFAVGTHIDGNGWGTIRPRDWLAGVTPKPWPPAPPPPPPPSVPIPSTIPLALVLGSGAFVLGIILALSQAKGVPQR